MPRATLTLTRTSPSLVLWRVTAVIGLALVLLAQLWVAGHQSVASAMGTEVCSASGVVRVTAEGQPLPLAGVDHGHDCCLALGIAALPEPLTFAMQGLSHASPLPRLGVVRLSAQALTPLSRGPPAFS